MTAKAAWVVAAWLTRRSTPAGWERQHGDKDTRSNGRNPPRPAAQPAAAREGVSPVPRAITRRREGGDFARRKQATVALLALASGLGASPGAAGGNLLSLVRHPGERVNQREVHHRGLPGLQWPVRACSR